MKTGGSPSYLFKEPYSYYFRIKVPKDLQPTISRKELRYSLRTGSLSDAKSKARYMAGQVQVLFRNIQNGCFDSMELSQLEIQDMVKRFFQERIEYYNKPTQYINAPSTQDYPEEYDWDDPYANEWDPDWRTSDERLDPSFRNQEGLEDTINFIEDLKTDLNLKLQTGNYSLAERNADRLLSEDGYKKSDIRKTSTSYAKLCSGIYRAWIKSLDY